MSLDIVPPLAYSGSIMDWTVVPQVEDNFNEDAPYFYGVRQSGYNLYIASGCCGAIMVKADSIGSGANCSICSRNFPISPFDGFRAETEPFKLFWGGLSWDEVEKQTQLWLDFYLNLKRDGAVAIFFNNQNWKDHIIDD